MTALMRSWLTYSLTALPYPIWKVRIDPTVIGQIFLRPERMVGTADKSSLCTPAARGLTCLQSHLPHATR